MNCRNLIWLSFALFFFGLFIANEVSAKNNQENIGLDVNDVSFLLPLKNKKPFPLISLKNDVQLPIEIFQKILKFENPQIDLNNYPYMDGKFVTDLSRWFVTSIRFELCGEKFKIVRFTEDKHLEVDRDLGCMPRARIVVQPFNNFGNPIATAIHLLYIVNPLELGFLASSLKSLKLILNSNPELITTGKPLSLHPVLLKDSGLSEVSEYSDALKTLILQLINRSSYVPEIATMTIQFKIDHWRFVGGYILNRDWKKFTTTFSKELYEVSEKGIGLGIEELSCNGNSICLYRPLIPFSGADIPNTNSLSFIFQDVDELKKLQVEGFRNDIIHIKSENIDNPNRTHFFNTNCISCHSSANLRDRKKLHTDMGLPENISPFVSKKFMTPLTNNIINFGYWGVVPRISTRTANDSMYASSDFNKLLGLKNPAEKILDINQLWNCVVSETDYNKCY